MTFFKSLFHLQLPLLSALQATEPGQVLLTENARFLSLSRVCDVGEAAATTTQVPSHNSTGLTLSLSSSSTCGLG